MPINLQTHKGTKRGFKRFVKWRTEFLGPLTPFIDLSLANNPEYRFDTAFLRQHSLVMYNLIRSIVACISNNNN